MFLNSAICGNLCNLWINPPRFLGCVSGCGFRIVVVGLILIAFDLSAQAQAVVGQVVGSSIVQGAGSASGEPQYAFYGNHGFPILTNNGLVVYAWGGRTWGISYNSYIDLNDLSVNVASSPVPSGNLTLNKVIGKNGDQVILSWKLN